MRILIFLAVALFSISVSAQVPQIVPPPRAAGPVVTYEIDVRGAGEILFQGPMKVGPFAGASYNREFTEAADFDCPSSGPGDYQRAARRASSFRLSLSNGYGQRENGPRSVNVRWTRAAPPACSKPSGTRTIELAQAVAVAPGESASFESDGVTVTIKRRN